MTDILDQRLRASPEAFASGVGAETVLLQLKRGEYFGMDPIGTLIWNGINEGRSPREICRDVAAEHGIGIERVEDDARAFLEDLKANEILIAD